MKSCTTGLKRSVVVPGLILAAITAGGGVMKQGKGLPQTKSMNNKMNILWIMTDQHRADCLGFMGHPLAKTPHLDRLAKAGVVFENAFCQSPVCMASRASLFTGRYPEAIRVRGMGVLPPSEITFPETLKRAGYLTAAFGKTHLTPEQYTHSQLKSDVPSLDWRQFADQGAIAPIPDDPFKRNYGFDIHVGCDDANQGLFRRWLEKANPALAAAPGPISNSEMGDLYVSPYPSEFHQTTWIAGRCEAFMREQAVTAQPWFAFCSFIAPHHPFEAPADQIARYPLTGIPLPAFKGGVDASLIPPPMVNAVGEMSRYSEDTQRQLVQHYLASISLIDDAVGRLVAALEQTGQRDNTLIVFASDHGEFLGNHGLLRKPSLHYDEVIRVPLLMVLPNGTGAGRRVSGLVELVDVAPTLLGLLGVAAPQGVQGLNWAEALHAGAVIARQDIYSDMYDLDPMRCAKASGPFGSALTLRTAEWKLTLYPEAGRQYGQLFHLTEDPDESHNGYADPAWRDIREELVWRLLRRMHQNTDPLPLRLTQW